MNNVSLSFRKSEFVAILGPSGSGKTTFLNVVGGLDRYDSGELIINGKPTDSFTDSDWDAYRNNSIGFIFQSYNLINHLSVLDNVEMGMTLSGVDKQEKRERALSTLEMVGLKEHVNKKPNQLSGGQMQRVAIARALVNNPDIILADEPTGALDNETSLQIMDLIRKIASDKLVIMVTHNAELANGYADRIINFLDGEVSGDSNPYNGTSADEDYNLKKTSMSYSTALNLSGKNILSKKARTALTAFASSIGIIGIALILSLSNGFQEQIESYQSSAMEDYPIIILPMSSSYSEEDMETITENVKSAFTDDIEYADTTYILAYDLTTELIIHYNDISDEFIEYLNGMDESIVNSISTIRNFTLSVLYQEDDGSVTTLSLSSASTTDFSSVYSMSSIGLYTYPDAYSDESTSFLESNYDVLFGSYPENAHEIVLVVDSQNRVDTSTLATLGFFDTDDETMEFSDIVGTQYKVAGNDLLYTYNEDYELYLRVSGSALAEVYDDEDCITLTIVGIVRPKEDASLAILSTGIAYSESLIDEITAMNQESEVYQAQLESETAVFFSSDVYSSQDEMLAALCADPEPICVLIYPYDFDTKDEIIAYLDAYNDSVGTDNAVIYTDLSETITELTGSIMDTITLVLVAFASISLIVSLIMIAVITYISVIERTREIGILRALGARAKDITRVFNAETFITGLVSGAMGIVIAYLLMIPMNIFIYNYSGLSGVAKLPIIYAILLIVIDLVLTLLGGFIPARMAAKKDPVVALRTE